MDLAIVVNGDHANNCCGRCVAGKHYGPWSNPFRIASIGQNRPTEAVVILGIDVCHEVNLVCQSDALLCGDVRIHNAGCQDPAVPETPSRRC